MHRPIMTIIVRPVGVATFFFIFYLASLSPTVSLSLICVDGGVGGG